jgi:serine/threonine protein kinase
VAALNHPNIVTIHSVDEVDGRLFLTMELVDGQPLADLIRPGGLPLDQLLAIATPLADAVSAAHARGITHRDLKPANVMVTPTRQVKVLDFGLAKLLDTSVVTDSMATEAPQVITGQGKILGTIAYMAPEQAEGKPVDARSDVFSARSTSASSATRQTSCSPSCRAARRERSRAEWQGRAGRCRRGAKLPY